MGSKDSNCALFFILTSIRIMRNSADLVVTVRLEGSITTLQRRSLEIMIEN